MRSNHLQDPPAESRFAISAFATGTDINFAGSEERYRILADQQETLEQELESLRRLLATDPETLTPSGMSHLRTEHQETLFRVLRMTEHILQDRMDLLGDMVRASGDYREDHTEAELEKARKHFEEVGLDVSCMNAYQSNLGNAERQYIQFLKLVPDVTAAFVDRDLRRAKVKQLSADLAKTRAAIETVASMATKMLA